MAPARFEAIARQKGLNANQRAAYMARSQEKEQRVNDLDRDVEFEMMHTLLDGTKPIRHQMLSRARARKLNAANRQFQTGLYWLLGRQKIASLTP